jgi:predicted permease
VLSLSTTNFTVTLPLGTDWRVLLFTASVAALTCLLFGAAPALRASRGDPVTAMRASGRGVTATRERFTMQRAMVVTQVSVSLMLLAGALLFVRSFYNLMTFDPGIRKKAITVAQIGFWKSNIAREHMPEFTRELEEEVRSVPGVLHAATTTMVPLMGSTWGFGLVLGSVENSAYFTWVAPGYFDTMGIPLLAGRRFRENDTATSERVAVVNQTFVRVFLNGANPIGQSFRTLPEPDYPATVYTIVGVIPDTKYHELRAGTPAMAFAPASQFPEQRPFTDIMIYSNLPPSTVIESVRHRFAQKHPEIVAHLWAFDDAIHDRLVQDRLMAMLSGFFALLAALLGMTGLYGVISYVVTRRRNEIGIRMALGADRGRVIGMVMREAALLLAVGVGIGAVLALVAGRSASSLLFGLKPYDPVTLMSAIGLLLTISVAASFLPALRASRLDPMTALRCE